MNQLSLEDKINEITTQYYSEHSKSFIFKQKQKNDCACAITNKIPAEELLQQTIYIGRDAHGRETNEIFVNYVLFKTFATPALFDQTIDYIMTKIGSCLNTFGSFVMNVNMQSFSATALQKYKPIIENFCKRCLNDDVQYSTNLQALRIYNAPTVMTTVFKMFAGFVDPSVWSKIQIQSPDTKWV
jgi:hypothetical protein